MSQLPLSGLAYSFRLGPHVSLSLSARVPIRRSRRVRQRRARIPLFAAWTCQPPGDGSLTAILLHLQPQCLFLDGRKRDDHRSRQVGGVGRPSLLLLLARNSRYPLSLERLPLLSLLASSLGLLFLELNPLSLSSGSLWAALFYSRFTFAALSLSSTVPSRHESARLAAAPPAQRPLEPPPWLVAPLSPSLPSLFLTLSLRFLLLSTLFLFYFFSPGDAR